jgi:hypothetical protein
MGGTPPGKKADEEGRRKGVDGEPEQHQALSKERAWIVPQTEPYEVDFRGFCTSRFGATIFPFASGSFGAIGVVTSL